MTFTVAKIEEIEAHLGAHPYLSEGGLPGALDAQIFFDLGKTPDATATPNTHYWYLFLNCFNTDILKKWIEKTANKTHHKQEKKVQKKEETKSALDDDLFGDEPTAEVKPKAKVEPVKKVEKKKAVAKSIVVFEVKVYEKETDLDVLAKKIFENIKIEGLTWNNEPKKLEVAYGIQKLQLGCVIVDDLVLTDDIFEPIEAWEEVQSVDMISMQKL